MFRDCVLVGLGAVPFVAVKSVLRVLLVEFHHDPISGDLGNYCRGCHGHALAVAFHNGTLRDFQFERNRTVYEQIVGRGSISMTALRIARGGLIYVDLIDYLRGDNADSDSDRLFPDLRTAFS